jgi:glutamyl-tRNA reductase
MLGAGMKGGKSAPTAAAPDVYATAWVTCLKRHTTVQPRRSVAHLEQLVHRTVKDLKKAGRKRDARELAELFSAWNKKEIKETWAKIKARFAELELSEKAYRSLKQSKADPRKALAKLVSRRAEEFRGASAKRVGPWLSS